MVDMCLCSLHHSRGTSSQPRKQDQATMSYVGRHVSTLPTPALLVDREKVEGHQQMAITLCFQFQKNCQRMLDLAATNSISLRGQTKTHKTVEGGILQTGWRVQCVNAPVSRWHKEEDSHLHADRM